MTTMTPSWARAFIAVPRPLPGLPPPAEGRAVAEAADNVPGTPHRQHLVQRRPRLQRECRFRVMTAAHLFVMVSLSHRCQNY